MGWRQDIINELDQLRTALTTKVNELYTDIIQSVSASGATTIDYKSGKMIAATMTADSTFNFTLPDTGRNVVIEMILDGNFNPTFSGATQLVGSADYNKSGRNHITFSINHYSDNTNDIFYTIQWV